MAKITKVKKDISHRIPETTEASSSKQLTEYQNSLKKNLNTLSSCFSLILIILGLYLLVNGLFGIVNKNGLEQPSKFPITDNANQSTDNTGKPSGSIDGDGLFKDRVQAETSSASVKAMETSKEIELTHEWRATDYEKGDIGIGSYEVKLGDTLWEIADAVYGDGFKWTKILEDNKSQIGFLPDGSQALIVPGQTLMINKLNN